MVGEKLVDCFWELWPCLKMVPVNVDSRSTGYGITWIRERFCWIMSPFPDEYRDTATLRGVLRAMLHNEVDDS